MIISSDKQLIKPTVFKADRLLVRAWCGALWYAAYFLTYYSTELKPIAGKMYIIYPTSK